MPRILLVPVIALACIVPTRAAEEGFVALFDGKTLDGWQGDLKGYMVEDGNLICKGGNLYTAKEYGDFVLRLEIKLPPGGNNGVGIRAPLKGDAAYVGMEIQVLDDSAPQYAGKIKPYQHHGSIYGVVAAKPGHLRPIGAWNEEEITCKGSHITVKLNGEVIVDADIAKFASGEEKTPDGRDHPGLKQSKGYIGFLGHGAPVVFRNIRIKEIK